MTQHRYPMLTLICTTAILVVPAAAFGKAACELKQMVTGEEFESLQKQWNVDHALPKSRDSYGHKDPDKCADRNQAFRSCLGKAGVDVKDNRGTKTEAVYKFFQPEKSGPD